MRKKYVFFVMLLSCLFFSRTVYAESDEEILKTESLTITEENRYNPEYYQEPEERYPVVNENMMRSAQLTLEECVVNAWENFETEIDISAYGISRAEASANYLQILNNHPSFFYVVSSVGVSYNSSTNMALGYIVEYIDTEENILAQQADFNKEVEKAQTWVTSGMSDMEKALAVHDYLVLECEYDKENLDKNMVPDVSHSAYGALVDKIAVCDGYSKAYACVLDELGIKSTIVSSESMDHAWNLVSLGGEWYHVDATWDDPTWDCIGRVGHNYFLLSDEVISDSTHQHSGWNVGYEAVSKIYDNEFWSEVTSAFCYQNGNWYFARYDENSGATNLVKRPESLRPESLLNASEEIVYTEKNTWNNYRGCLYLDLEPIKNELYFNTTTGIYKLDKNGAAVKVYEPERPDGQIIFGFTLRGNLACYALQATPNNTSKQVVVSYEIEGLQLPQITGIDVENQKTVYDGTAKQIKVEGTQADDKVTYKHGDGIYREEQPEMKDAGTYQVSYRVEREGYLTYTGTAQIVIEKAKPEYSVPVGLKGNAGNLLEQVELPKGFLWENGSAELRGEGEITGYVSYVPEDTQNYEIVSNIPVKITVSSSPSTITVKGVSGLKTSKATTNSLKFTWKKVNGAKYRVVLYKGNKAVSTVYINNTSYTCKKLKAATLYTVKVTSYVESNGTKTYASAVSLKAATAPAKAKLSSVKKKGSTKAKLTWKKVTGADGYELFMRTGNGSYKKIKTITKGKTVTFTKSGLKKGKSYKFRIRAYKKAGSQKSYGSYSNIKTLKIK